jgi:predicted secreted protein
MNKTVARFFAPFVFLSAFCGCASVEDDAAPAPQPTFGIELRGNPTTGFLWSWEASPEGGVAEIAPAEYRRDGEPSSTDGVEQPRVGQGGTFTFRFAKTVKEDVAITFSYARPWETDKAPAETAAFVVSGWEKLQVTRK